MAEQDDAAPPGPADWWPQAVAWAREDTRIMTPMLRGGGSFAEQQAEYRARVVALAHWYVALLAAGPSAADLREREPAPVAEEEANRLVMLDIGDGR